MAYGQEKGGKGNATAAGEGKAVASSYKGCAAHTKLMAATKAGGKVFVSEAAGKLSEKTKG